MIRAKQAPAHGTARAFLREPQIPQRLAGQRARTGRPIQAEIPGLALLNHEREAEPRFWLGFGQRLRLQIRAAEHQGVRDVLTPLPRLLLGQQVTAEEPQQGEDEKLLGLSFRGRAFSRKSRVERTRLGTKGADSGIINGGPFGERPNAGVEKITAKQSATQYLRASSLIHAEVCMQTH